MKVSLVIPVRDEEQSLPALLQSILRQTRPPDEVILVDGGSTDRTVGVARRATAADGRFRVIEAGPATPGRGRNVGIAAAQHDWIALTDAGIQLEPSWLERLVEVTEQVPSVEVVYGNYEPVLNTFFERCAGLAYVPAKKQTPGGKMRGPFIASSLLRREVWQAVGGFPDLRAAEDLILMERLEASGARIGRAPAATVHWQLQPTLARTFRKFALYSKHNVWAVRQRYWHHDTAKKYLAVLLFILLGVLHSPWWFALPVGGALARVAKSIWQRRDGRGVLWLLNPAQFAAVGVILAVIDLATFVGWAQATWQRCPLPASEPPYHTDRQTSPVARIRPRATRE